MPQFKYWWLTCGIFLCQYNDNTNNCVFVCINSQFYSPSQPQKDEDHITNTHFLIFFCFIHLLIPSLAYKYCPQWPSDVTARAV